MKKVYDILNFNRNLVNCMQEALNKKKTKKKKANGQMTNVCASYRQALFFLSPADVKGLQNYTKSLEVLILTFLIPNKYFGEC